MAKRFTDTNIWKKGWFMKLPARLKLLWKFITDDCDAAGVWEPNFEMASLFVGEEVTEMDLKTFGTRIEKIENGKFWLTSFIEFQYNNNLSEKSPAHKPVFSSISKNRLSDRVFNRVSDTLQEKEQYKEEEKEKEEVKDFGKSENLYGNELTSDAEQTVLSNPIRFEQLCMNKQIPEETARDALRNYHLYNIEKDRYPMNRTQAFAGFERWLSTEKKIFPNAKHKKSTSGGRGQAGRDIVLEDIQRDIQLTAQRARDA